MKVYFDKGCRKSGKLLAARLKDVEGPSINWGYARDGELNRREAILLATNKKRALVTMRNYEVPTPEIFVSKDEVDMFPVIGRDTHHTRNSGFYFIRNKEELDACPATHFLEYIESEREFRVHIIDGYSVKISEKFKKYDPETGEFKEGSWKYPHDFKRKRELRDIARDAVEVLGLDFGAVDVLLGKDGGLYVLEVNTAPDLETPSTLDVYVKAFERIADNVPQPDDIVYEPGRWPFGMFF